ncbi:MAG: CHASE sensor domain-containing protein, partial [Gammaproteobacteria bacterium]
MPRFRDLPLRRKLVLAVGLTSGAVLTVACAALFLFQAYSLRQSITREASAIARIVAAQTSAALAFEDRQAAAQALAALEATPHVVRALLVTRDGRTLAQYRAGYRGLGGRDGSARKQALLFGRLTHSEAVIVDGKAIGTLLLTVDFERPWRDLIASYVKAMGLMVAIALLLIFVLSRFFQRVVSEPTLRAEEALQRAHDGLEALVRARTQELAEANERLQGLDRLKSMFI